MQPMFKRIVGVLAVGGILSIGSLATSTTVAPPANAATVTGHINVTSTVTPTVYVGVNEALISNPAAAGFNKAGARTWKAVSVKRAAAEGTTANDTIIAYDDVTGNVGGLDVLRSADNGGNGDIIITAESIRGNVRGGPTAGPGQITTINTSGVAVATQYVPKVLPGPTGCPNNWGDGTQAGGYHTNYTSYVQPDPVVSTCATPLAEVGVSYTPGYGVTDAWGVVGLGDLVVTPDKASIVVANRNDGHLYTGPVMGSGALTQISTLPAFATDNTWRPSALRVHSGQIMVGWTHISLTNQNKQPLEYAVAFYNPTTGLWKTAVPPATSTGILRNDGSFAGAVSQMKAAILSSMDVDSFGKLQVTFIDLEDQVKPALNGWGAEPVLVLVSTGVETWTNAWATAPQIDVGALTKEYSKTASFGHIVRNPLGAGAMVLTSEDPESFNAGGLAYLPDSAPATGTGDNMYQYARAVTPDSTDILGQGNVGAVNDPYSFGKGNGMGALALLADTGEYGDRVWADQDHNGIQDTGEASVPGVVLEVQNADGTPYLDATGTPAVVVTDSTGRYTVVVPAGVPTKLHVADSNFVGAGVFATGTYAGWDITQQAQGSDRLIDSNADPVTRQVLGAAGTMFPAGTNDYSFDIGVYQKPPTVSVGDFVFEDLNHDGVQSAGDPGVAGVTATLYAADGVTLVTVDADGNPAVPQVTPASGAYQFANLPAGQYTVKFTTIPSGYLVTTSQNFATIPSDSNGLVATSVLLSGGENDPSLDLGLFRPVSVGDYVWVDGDVNDNQDSGEIGVAGVTATIYHADCLNITTDIITSAAFTTFAATDCVTPVTVDVYGNPVIPQVTPASGKYLFTGLFPGKYVVMFTTLPVGYVVTVSADNLSVSLDSNGLIATSEVLPSGSSDLTLDLGIYSQSSVGDKVWEDLNRNGMQDAGEPGIAGITATVYWSDTLLPVRADADGNPISPQVTNVRGNYAFTNLLPGKYVVKFTTLPVGYQVTTSADTLSNGSDSNGLTATSAVLTGGASDMTLDLGLFRPVAVGNFAFLDANADGQQGSGEAGVPGITATLYAADGVTLVNADADGGPVVPAVTDSNGGYLFANLLPGKYVVKFTTLPAGYLVTKSADTPDNGSDSNGLTATSIAVPSGANDLSLDIGIFLPVSVGSRVWLDANRNGLQDSGEVGVAGITVTLYEADGVTKVTVDATGAPIAPFVTTVLGTFSFNNLAPGTYVVKFTTLPAAFAVTASADKPGVSTDSNGLVATSVNLAGGQSDMTLALGLYPASAVNPPVKLPKTGSNILTLVGLAFGLLLVGGAIVLGDRRRRATVTV
jgi:LPXTG-motif cell wall-anchored protein